MEDNETIKTKIETISNLPTLPEIVVRILKIINDPTTSAQNVAQLVCQDLSLSAKILRLANSAFYGVPRSITGINQAVVLLGLKIIRTIVLSLTVFDMFPGDRHSTLFNRTAFWRHCTSCGLLCRFLAEEISNFSLIDGEEAFCAGLLHDIGKVVMEQYLHDDFHKALQQAKSKKLSMYDAEKKLLGYTHTDVALWLTSGWNLPASIQVPMVFHHTPSGAADCAAMTALCHFADHLCYELKLTIDEDYIGPPLDGAALRLLGISDECIGNVKLRLAQELDKVDLFCAVASGI